MGSDDEYGAFPDETFTAALAAAERLQRTAPLPPAKATPAAPAAAPNAKPPPPKAAAPVQPRPRKVGGSGKGSAIIVSPRQKGNPLLSHIRSCPWEYGPSTLSADYLVGASTAALFLSLKYHKLHPDYVHTRLAALGTAHGLRVLLVLVDVDEHAEPLRALTKACLLAGASLLLAWSAAEAARYLELFKTQEHTAPTAIREKVAEDFGSRLVDVFTKIRGVNKTDAVRLVSTFGSIRRAVNASPEEVLMISGWGQQKVARLESAVGDGFTAGKRKAVRTDDGGKKKRTAKSGADADGVAARLGIGSVAAATPSVPQAWVIEDDDDALAAVAEYEAAEAAAARQRRSIVREGAGRPTDGGEEKKHVDVDVDLDVPDVDDDGVGAGIMEALAKLREKKG